MDALDNGQHHIRPAHPRAQHVGLALDTRLMQAQPRGQPPSGDLDTAEKELSPDDGD